VARPRSAAWAECKVEATPAWGGIQAFEFKERQLPLADLQEDSRDSWPATVQPRARIC
jgi:hypothetical protein